MKLAHVEVYAYGKVLSHRTAAVHYSEHSNDRVYEELSSGRLLVKRGVMQLLASIG